MSLDLDFRFPDNVVPLDLVLDGGAVAAAQTALGRFDSPVDRESAAALESTFIEFRDRMRAAEADLAFAIVPDPPYLGVFGTLLVRRLPGGDDALDRAVDELDASRHRALEAPLVDRRPTQLGEAVRVHQRLALEADELTARGTKVDLELVEVVSWLWHLDDVVEGDAVLALTYTSNHLDESVRLVGLVDTIAEAITRA